MLVFPGLRKLISSKIQQLFNSASFDAPLTHSLVLERGTGSATFTRATTGSVQDHEGVLRTAIAGEARFTGARRVRNLLASTTTLSTQNVTTTAGTYILSFYGTGSVALSGTVTDSLAGTGASTRVNKTVTCTAGTLTLTVTGSVTSAQLEDITGRADQTTPSEYVSVGVESAPYHGAGVDGVKYFDVDLSGNPLPTSYTYDAVSLNGVAGTYVSTPDSVAASITGDIDIRWYGTTSDWTPAAASALVDKFGSAGSRSWQFGLDSTGVLFLWLSSDGTANTVYPSTVAVTAAPHSFAANAYYYCRATRSSSSGTIKFYTSTDGTTWTQLGTDVASTAGALIDNAEPVRIGHRGAAGSDVFSGSVRQAQIYNGINGTLAVDFDASRYAGGSTLTGSTGETWTLQGNAVIHPTNQPMLGYQAEGARTNLCLQSNAFTTAPWGNNGPLTLAQDATGPDGGTTAWTITDDAAGTIEFLTQYFSATAANYTFSIRVKKTTGAQSSYPVVNLYDEVSKVAGCTIDTTNGIATVWTGWTGLTIVTSSASCVSYNDDYWRVSLTALLTAATWRLTIIPAATTNATQATGEPDATVTGSAVFYGAQVELGSFASSYIPTTTIAVARNADVLTYSSAGNVSGTAGWAYAEYASTPSASVNKYILDLSAPSGNRPALWDSSGTSLNLYDGTGTRSLKALSGQATGVKIASTWGGSACTGAVSGSVGSAQSFDGDMNVGASIGIGGTTSAEPYGTIRNVRIGQRALSSSELQAITK